MIPERFLHVVNDLFVRRELGRNPAGPPKAETLVLREVFEGFGVAQGAFHGQKVFPRNHKTGGSGATFS